MHTLNQAHIDAVLALINRAPYFQLLNMDIRELGMGYCKLVVEMETKHLNAFGGIHGGAYASMLDTAAYWAVYCEMDEDAGFTTIDIKTDNLRAKDSGTITVIGKSIKKGRSICLCEAEARDEAGNLLAFCTAKQFVGPTLQPISAAVESLGSEHLPPKFLS